MRANDNWPEARERLTALWRGQQLDRPCIGVTAPSGDAQPRLVPPEDPEAFWLDPAWIRRKVRAEIEGTWWGGEAVPSSLLLAGWVVSLGGKPSFDRKTIWFETGEPDFAAPPPWRYRAGDPWVAKFHALHRAVAEEAGRDDFQLGSPCMLPANDLISMHMGAQQFLLALMDQPEWMRRAIVGGAEGMAAARRDAQGLVKDRHDYWYGIAGWMPFWAPEPFVSTQSDVSCMLSPEMFEEFVVPELDICGRECGALWYHLDGRDAQQHLPRLLSLPYMRVIQYTPTPAEPPNGPAHLDLYRRIQAAGRIVHIQVPADLVEPLCRELDASRLMLSTSCASPEEGRQLLADAVRWSRRN
ncbi:MAG TPA: hypothetical protein PK280_21085 [Planctomycetota bacterium]|nr:hypothetical protein [Planctomycetota bacterium]